MVMKKKMKTYNKILILIIILAPVLLMAGAVYAANLTVEFENSPLFNISNLTPNETILKYIKVTNGTTESKNIAVEAINILSCSTSVCLSSALDLKIKEGSNVLYENTLFNFYSASEVVLSTLSASSTIQYDFIITFRKSAGNEYQGLSTGFDLLVGFKGEQGGGGDGDDGGGGAISGGGGGGGGGNGPISIPSGLIIKDESVIKKTLDGKATFYWNTNYPATSQVVYGLDNGSPYNLNLYAVNYGYPKASPEDSQHVINHTVIVGELELGKTYRYRVISHTSPLPVLSFERTFTMPILGQQEIIIPPLEGVGGPTVSLGGAQPKISTTTATTTEEIFENLTIPDITKTGGEQEEGNKGKFFAAIAGGAKGLFNNIIGLFSKIPWWVCFILILLFLLVIIWLWRKKKKEEPEDIEF